LPLRGYPDLYQTARYPLSDINTSNRFCRGLLAVSAAFASRAGQNGDPALCHSGPRPRRWPGLDGRESLAM